MAEHEPPLAATEPLDGLERRIGAVTLSAIEGRALVCMAFPAARRDTVSARVSDRLGIALPDISRCTGDAMRLIGLQRDQVWCTFASAGASAADDMLAERLGEDHGVRLTDQSGGWAQLRIDGADAVAVLERLCPLDLHERALPVDGCARTAMEHLGVIIVRTAPDSFELLTARSSAHSFVHALETAAGHVAAERTLTGSGPVPTAH